MRAISTPNLPPTLGRASSPRAPAEVKPANTFTRKAPGGSEGIHGARREPGRPQMPMEHLRELVKSGSTYELRNTLGIKEKYGIDVNAAAPQTGKRLLHDAFEHIDSHPVQSDIVKLLLSHGGDPNLRNEQGLTPLDVATHREKPNPHAIGQLINAGAEVSDLAMSRGMELRRGDARWMYFMLCDAPRLK
jgi:hypothetical protein